MSPTSSGVDDPRAEGAGALEILAGPELRRVVLVVADRAVVEARIARDMVPDIGLGDVAAGLADDDGKLALVVELVARGGADHRLP
jgi:hypothetical protein